MNNDLQEKILKILKASPSGLQMEEIASNLGLTRHTVAKYVEILRAEGKIHFQKIGRSKLWKEISTATNIRHSESKTDSSGTAFFPSRSKVFHL